MRVKTGLAVAVFLIIVAACDSEEPTSTFTVGTPTLEPDAQATIIAQAMAPKGGTPTPTTIPAEEREVVLKFA